MAEHPEESGIHTIAVSKLTAGVLITCATLFLGGFAGTYWDLTRSNYIQGEHIAQLKQTVADLARNSCTVESCQNLRASVERLRNEAATHDKEAQGWIRRIVTCEFKVDDCAACRINFGLKGKVD